MTSSLSATRSNQLSYEPVSANMIRMAITPPGQKIDRRCPRAGGPAEALRAAGRQKNRQPQADGSAPYAEPDAAS